MPGRSPFGQELGADRLMRQQDTLNIDRQAHGNCAKRVALLAGRGKLI
jgi:hypothetical protein